MSHSVTDIRNQSVFVVRLSEATYQSHRVR